MPSPSPSRYTLKVTTFSSFAALPAACARLFDPSATQDVFDTLPWFLNFEKHALNPGDQVRIYTVSRGKEQAPLAALAMRAASNSRSWLRSRKLSSLTNFYTSRFAPACTGTGAERTEALAVLADAIRADSPRWDTVHLRPLDAGSELFEQMGQAFRRSGLVVHPYFCFGNWYLPVGGRNFEQYLESLPAKARNTLQRKTKKLEKSGIARIEIVTGTENLEPAIEAYQKVYNASWKVPEPYPKFVPGLMRTCAENGWLRLGLVYIEGEPAAAQIWIVHGASIYKLAYDERFAQHSVGTILTARLMQHALDVDRVNEVDYLTGDDPYKKDWMSHRRELWGLLAFNPATVRGLVEIARHMGGRAAKSLLRRLAGRPAHAPAAAQTV
jgi:hypothetical protein